MKETKVRIYGRSSCVFCTKSKKLCDQHNVAYTFHEVSDPTTFGFKTVPQIYVNDVHIGGYQQLEELFNKRASTPTRVVESLLAYRALAYNA